MNREIDINLFMGQVTSKVFNITNSDGSIYDLTGSTVVMRLYLTATPLDIPGTINVTTGGITIPFTGIHTSNAGLFEYYIIETKSGNTNELVKGNIIVENYTPFTFGVDAYLKTELPANINLELNYKNQRLIYWRNFMYSAFDIAEPDINTETAWPNLANALLAKLIAHDALTLATKGSLLHFLGGDFSQQGGQGGPIKKIETGPSNVEFYSIADTLDGLFTPNASGLTALDMLSADICGLANHLKVKVPMCKQNNWVNPIIPKYYQNPDWVYPKLSEENVSIG